MYPCTKVQSFCRTSDYGQIMQLEKLLCKLFKGCGFTKAGS